MNIERHEADQERFKMLIKVLLPVNFKTYIATMKHALEFGCFTSPTAWMEKSKNLEIDLEAARIIQDAVDKLRKLYAPILPIVDAVNRSSFLPLLLVVGLAVAAQAEEIKCFGKDRGVPGCKITRLDDIPLFKDSPRPWWKFCEQDRQPNGFGEGRPAFEMYPTTRHCAVACAATAKELEKSAACYNRYLGIKPARRGRKAK